MSVRISCASIGHSTPRWSPNSSPGKPWMRTPNIPNTRRSPRSAARWPRRPFRSIFGLERRKETRGRVLTSKRRTLFAGFLSREAKMNRTIRGVLVAAFFTTLLSLPLVAQQVKRTPFDVTNYLIDVAISPSERKLTATVDVSFTPLEDTRSVAFELNGSLKVDSIARLDHPMVALPVTSSQKTKAPVTTAAPGAVTFVQDQTNSSDLG